MKPNLATLRRSYHFEPLTSQHTPACPFSLFENWLNQALISESLDPNAMTLATVDASGQPQARVVLLKGFSKENGWLFYTNYLSAKGQDLAANPKCSLLFWWEGCARQVRVIGEAKKLSPEISDAYFKSRPKGSQLGALASNQSQVIANRDELLAKQEQLEKEFAGVEALERPNHWGGYQIIANKIEFWQGQPNRLHDRLVYELQTDGGWGQKRLAP